MKNKTVIITGATSGIGKVAADALAGMGASLLLVGRNEAKGSQTIAEIKSNTGNPNLSFLKADLSSMDEVRRLAGEINSQVDKIDVLLNNAGAVFTKFQKTIDSFEMTLALNHLSPFLLTHLLMDRIKAASTSRIITVSSMAHKMASLDFDNLMFEKGYNSWAAYSNSKLANILFTYQLARNLENSKITANTLHPGFVKTNFGRSNGGFLGWLTGLSQVFAITVEEGAKTSIHLASSPEVERTSGKYFVQCKLAESSPASYDEKMQSHLWEISQKLTGVN
jgi:NAD(P)-dependent dehydrogenase (short-subunit alcohol dehydrogenase family)